MGLEKFLVNEIKIPIKYVNRMKIYNTWSEELEKSKTIEENGITENETITIHLNQKEMKSHEDVENE